MNSATATLRPGMRMGVQPERRADPDKDDLDQWMERWCSHRIHSKLSSLQRFSGHLDKINTAQARFASLDLVQRNSAILSLRHELQQPRVGLSQRADTFGLISLGVRQTLGFTLHDEQLYAGWCLHEGHFVEMQTGEGKTLTAALPAIAMALSGVPVHVVTSNDYLAKRDHQSLLSLYQWFGLRTGVVSAEQSDDDKRAAYACDITYCTHQQLVFDYLRDSQARGQKRAGLSVKIQELLRQDTPPALQRGLCFAIVDEADSVLIDDARTPLILAQPVDGDDNAPAEAAVALAVARSLVLDVHFRLNVNSRQVNLQPSGKTRIQEQLAHLNGGWAMSRYRDERIVQALTALHLYRRDVDYLVIENAIVLIDQSTGRPTPQRRLQHGLHRMLEVKERCAVTDETAPVSALSFQRFFTRYHRLCGMSGTLHEARHELRRVYGPRTLRVPTVRPSLRVHLPMRMHATRKAQMQELVEQVSLRCAAGQAVLVGTATVSLSDEVSRVLTHAKIAHTVLNARQDYDEALIVADAGLSGRVTVATNMAGRGTDIKCADSVIDSGGLHVINLEINDSARIERQLYGRSARQGEPGSCQDILCLDDDMLSHELNTIILTVLSHLIQNGSNTLRTRIITTLVRCAQKSAEARSRQQRMAVLHCQTQLQKLLAIGGYGE